MASPRRLIHPDWLQAPPRHGLPFWVRSVLTLSFLGYSGLLLAGGGLLFALGAGYRFDLDVLSPHYDASPPAVVYESTPAAVVSQARDTLAPPSELLQSLPADACIGTSCELAVEELPPAPIPPDPAETPIAAADEEPAQPKASPDPTDFILFDHEFVAGKKALTAEGEQHLEEMVSQMVDGPLPVLVEHPASNAPADLAEARKRTVMQFLTAHGVDAADQHVMMSRDFGRLSMTEFTVDNDRCTPDLSEVPSCGDPVAAVLPPQPPHPYTVEPQVLIQCRMVRLDREGIAKLLGGDEPIPQPVASLLKSAIEPSAQPAPRTLEADDAKWLADAIDDWAKQEGIVEVLSSPTLVTLVGQPAHVQVASAVPVCTSEKGPAAATEDFGTELTCTPWKVGNDRLRLHLDYELSDLCDRADQESGFLITKRGLKTVIDMTEGNTVALGPMPGEPDETSDSRDSVFVFLSAESVEPCDDVVDSENEAESPRAAAPQAVDVSALPDSVLDRFRAPLPSLSGPQIALELELIEVDRTAAGEQLAEGENAPLKTLLDWLSADGASQCEPALQGPILEAIQQLADSPAIQVVARPRLGVMYGQPASYGLGNAFPVFVPGEKGEEEPGHIEYRRYGVWGECAARLLPDGEVKVDLNFEQGSLTGQTDANGIPTVATVTMNTSLTAGDGETVLIRGLTCTAPATEEKPAADKTLVLLVTPRVVRIESCAPQWMSGADRPKKVAVLSKETEEEQAAPQR